MLKKVVLHFCSLSNFPVMYIGQSTSILLIVERLNRKLQPGTYNLFWSDTDLIFRSCYKLSLHMRKQTIWVSDQV